MELNKQLLLHSISNELSISMVNQLRDLKCDLFNFLSKNSNPSLFQKLKGARDTNISIIRRYIPYVKIPEDFNKDDIRLLMIDSFCNNTCIEHGIETIQDFKQNEKFQETYLLEKDIKVINKIIDNRTELISMHHMNNLYNKLCKHRITLNHIFGSSYSIVNSSKDFNNARDSVYYIAQEIELLYFRLNKIIELPLNKKHFDLSFSKHNIYDVRKIIKFTDRCFYVLIDLMAISNFINETYTLEKL